MMRYAFLLFLCPTLSYASKIPLDSFDQSKLETMLRNIPASLVKEENKGTFVRKHHEFPQQNQADFFIKCHADYYKNASIPSSKVCSVEIKDQGSSDEVSLKVTNPEIVNAFRQAISYGQEVKKFYATERVYGLSLEGKYRDLFRYSFVCQTQECALTFAKKE